MVKDEVGSHISLNRNPSNLSRSSTAVSTSSIIKTPENTIRGASGRKSVRRKSSFQDLFSRSRSASNTSETTVVIESRSPHTPSKTPTKSPRTPKSPLSLKSFASLTSSLKRRKSTQRRPTILRMPDGPELQHRTDLPPWDRTVDIVYHRFPLGSPHKPDKNVAFEKSVDLFRDKNSRSDKKGREGRKSRKKSRKARTGLLALPPAVRMRIWRHVIDDVTGDKPVSLTKRAFLKDVWRGDEFEMLGDAIQPLLDLLKTSFDFRADLMVAFLMMKRFHVTYSPFTGEMLNPASTSWLRQYAPYIQNLTVELDMTRFGFSHAENADLLPSGTIRMKMLIHGLVANLKKRKDCSTMESLIILCRRYYGHRRSLSSYEPPTTNPNTNPSTNPDTPATKRESLSLYCEDKNFDICDQFHDLRHLVDSLRTSGFTMSYTVDLMRKIFTLPPRGELHRYTYNVAPSNVYPRLPGQKSYVDNGRHSFVLDKHPDADEELPPLPGGRYRGALMLPPPGSSGSGGINSNSRRNTVFGEDETTGYGKKRRSMRLLASRLGGGKITAGSSSAGLGMWNPDELADRIEVQKTRVKELFTGGRLRRSGSI